MPTLRLLSVNARTLPLDHDRLARLVADIGPDLACIHGAPSLLRWRSNCAALARRAGLVVVSGGRTGGGNLALSTLGVDVTGTHDLSFSGTSGLRRPGATLAALRLRGSAFVLAAARLEGNAAQRLAQARELQTAIGRFVPGDAPVVISVDGADRPGTSSWALLSENRASLGSGLFVDERIGIDDAQELASPALTFPPAQADLALPGTRHTGPAVR